MLPVGLVGILLLSGAAVALPQVAFPFNSQVPPVARVGVYYSFTISPSTFTSTEGPLTFSLDQAPAWLTIDSATPTLIGTPGAGDIGPASFSILAADASGSCAMEATLIIASSFAPRLTVPLEGQLAAFGKLSGPTTLIYPPQTPVSITFDADTFSYTGKALSYYATLEDHTPLPAWLQFDAQTLTFSGVTPLLSQSPQNFAVLFIGSDVVGFAGATAGFTIAVSVHEFAFQSADESLIVGSGQRCDVQGLRDKLYLDGKPIENIDFDTGSVNGPSWLSFDPQSLDLNGSPPMTGETENVDVTITAADRYGDTANITIHMHILSGLFAMTLNDLNVTSGRFFEYTFNQSLFTRQDLRISVDLGRLNADLSFDTQNLTIYGTLPSKTAANRVQATLTAAVPNSTLQDHLIFGIDVAADPGSATSTMSGRSTQTPPSFAQGSSGGNGGNRGARKTAGLIIGVIIAVVFAILCCAVSCWYCRTSDNGLRRTKSALKRSISHPVVPDEDNINAQIALPAEIADLDLEKGSGDFERTPERPPQIVLEFSPVKPTDRTTQSIFHSPSRKRNSEHFLADTSPDRVSTGENSMDNDEAMILENFDRTSLGYLGGVSNRRRAHESMRLAGQISRDSRPSRGISGRAGLKSRLYGGFSPRRSNSAASGGLPVSRRLTGIGHGRASPLSSSGSNSMGMVQYRQSYESTSVGLTSSSSIHRDSLGTRFSPSPRSSNRLSRRFSQSSSRFSLSEPLQIQHGMQRPVPRRSTHRATFFAGGPNPGAARWSRRSGGLSVHRGRHTMLGLSTIRGSPDLGGAEHDQENREPVKKDKSNTHLQPPAAFSPKRPALSRGNTQSSQRSNNTWLTTTSGGLTSYSTRSASSELLAAPFLADLTSPKARTRPYGKRLAIYDGTLQQQASDVRSSVIFRDADDSDNHAEEATTGGAAALPRSPSSSLYSQSEDGSPSPTQNTTLAVAQTANLATARAQRPVAVSVRKAAERLARRANGASAMTRKAVGVMRDGSIMDRPRSYFRAPGARQSPVRELRQPVETAASGGSGVKRRSWINRMLDDGERLRLVSGKGKRPVSNDGSIANGIASLRGEMLRGEAVRGNEAFL